MRIVITNNMDRIRIRNGIEFTTESFQDINLF